MGSSLNDIPIDRLRDGTNGNIENQSGPGPNEGEMENTEIIGTNSIQEELPCLVGVQLITDVNADRGTNLGALVLPSHCRDISVKEARQYIMSQIVACPPEFTVCTKHGWAILENQETNIKLHQVLTANSIIMIKVKYENPKVGIKNREGNILGFIHANHNASLRSIKQNIFIQVLEPQGLPQTFHFIDANNWPISVVQESHVTVLDILIGSCVFITNNAKRKLLDEFYSPRLPPDKRLKDCKQLSFRSGKDIVRQIGLDNISQGTSTKQVLISYVRAEAGTHALHLKEELSALGLSVFLDVHEIKTGVDWQDSLNFAVSGCEVFVPLVTCKYGLTQWTNREVKLADVLGKYILPINFLLEWPPRCLAIQFASTQFIPWVPAPDLTDDQRRLEDLSMEPLNMTYLKRVADKIAERVRGLRLSSVPSLVKRSTIVRSCALVTEDNSMATTADREGKPLVVICLHPNEESHGTTLAGVLEKEGFEVWCTTQLDRKHLDHIDGLASSQEGENYLMSLRSGCYGDEGQRCIQDFQEKADEASVVLCVLSEAFAMSRTCQQQAFYCEHRKRMVHILYEDFQMPEWLAMLIGSQGFQLRSDEDYMDIIVRRVRGVTTGPIKKGASPNGRFPTSEKQDSKSSTPKTPPVISPNTSLSSQEGSIEKKPSLSSMNTVIL